MATAPRLYLFHGSDTRSSLEALHRWESVFLEKYGMATRYVIEADELTVDQVKQEISQRTQGVSLFPEPSLLVVKRLGSHEKTKAAGSSLKVPLQAAKSAAGPAMTIVFWEDQLLSDKSLIKAWFLEQQQLNAAKVTEHAAPSFQEVGTFAQKYLQRYGKTLDRPAARWLAEQYRQREKALRLVEKLKATEVLARDERSWWLAQILDAAAVCGGDNIDEATLSSCAERVESVSVFEIINAVRDRRWNECLRLHSAWKRDQDQGAYFGLWSLLRIHFRKLADVPSQAAEGGHALRLLAEIELAVKNSQAPYDALTDLFFLRLSEGSGTIVSTRSLWLAQLPLP